MDSTSDKISQGKNQQTQRKIIGNHPIRGEKRKKRMQKKTGCLRDFGKPTSRPVFILWNPRRRIKREKGRSFTERNTE